MIGSDGVFFHAHCVFARHAIIHDISILLTLVNHDGLTYDTDRSISGASFSTKCSFTFCSSCYCVPGCPIGYSKGMPRGHIAVQLPPLPPCEHSLKQALVICSPKLPEIAASIVLSGATSIMVNNVVKALRPSFCSLYDLFLLLFLVAWHYLSLGKLRRRSRRLCPRGKTV